MLSISDMEKTIDSVELFSLSEKVIRRRSGWKLKLGKMNDEIGCHFLEVPAGTGKMHQESDRISIA